MTTQEPIQGLEPPSRPKGPRLRREDPVNLSAMNTIRRTNNQRTLAVVLLCLFATVVLSMFSPWQQFVTGTGDVKALTPVERQQTIDAPVDGRVAKWHVIEGSRVKKGDLIVEIKDNDPNFLTRIEEQKRAISSRLDAAEDRQNAVQFRILDLQNGRTAQLAAARNRVDSARDRVRQAEQARDAIQARLKQNELQLRRRKEGVQGGVASVRELEVAQADYDMTAADLKRAQASYDEAQNILKASQKDLESVDATTNGAINAERATLATAAGEIQTQKVAMQDVDIRINRQLLQQVLAPADGTVFRLLVQPNAAILKSGEAIAEFVPDIGDGNLMAEIYVDGNDMPLIQKGRKVRLQFEGWNAVPFVGWPSVAIGTFGGEVYLVDPTSRGDGKFRVMVVPDAKDKPWPTKTFLRQGVRANGWVLLDQVSLGFEIWRRLNGFPPVVSSMAADMKGSRPADKN
jgi:membrane fusion protein, adhesin transport system